jgi:hypothetical protein
MWNFRTHSAAHAQRSRVREGISGYENPTAARDAAKLTANSNKAVEVLRKIFNDSKAPHSARVTAAIQTVRLAREGFFLESLEERIRRLEEQTNAS